MRDRIVPARGPAAKTPAAADLSPMFQSTLPEGAALTSAALAASDGEAGPATASA